MRILGLLVDHRHPTLSTTRLAVVSAHVSGTTGAGIMLMSGDVPRGSLATTDRVSALIEELQFSLGEGPCVDAYEQDRAMLEPDLADPVVPRWLAFSGPAVAAGARAVFGFPLRVGAVRLGALNLYRATVGPLSPDHHADALVAADITAQAILALQADASPGALAAELEAGAELQFVVHQAAGMIAAQLDISVGQALVRLRAYSFGHDRLLDAVAQDVVGRALRESNRSGEATPSR